MDDHNKSNNDCNYQTQHIVLNGQAFEETRQCEQNPGENKGYKTDTKGFQIIELLT